MRQGKKITTFINFMWMYNLRLLLMDMIADLK